MSPHQSPVTSHGFFVTGTDTGVGKTLVACALLHTFVAHGRKAVGMKPVAAGAEQTHGDWRNADVEALRTAGNVDAPLTAVNPYGFVPPVAPHIAADLQGMRIEPETIEHSYRMLSERADVVVVEGVGGFMVPLAPGFNTADLASRLGLPVILVVGMRLGCLNHALLTAEAIASRGLRLGGWVANHIEADMLHAERNVEALAQRLPGGFLGSIAWGVRDAAGAAAALHLGSIIAHV